MESKKNYKKPAMQVVEIQNQGHLLTPMSGENYARENHDNWSSED